MVHLGMIKALEEEGLTFSVISGTSAGAIVGALYCQGYTPDEAAESISGINFLKVLKPALNWRGLIKIDNTANELKKFIPHDRFEKLKIPLIVPATNLRKGKIVYFKKGPLITPILASCSIPVVFDPIEIDGDLYADGGLIDNLPVKPVKRKSDLIIGMHCNSIENNYDTKNWKELLERSMLLAVSSTTYLHKKKCDIFWEPPQMANYNVFDYKKAMEIYEIGYDFARKQIDQGALNKLLTKA